MCGSQPFDTRGPAPFQDKDLDQAAAAYIQVATKELPTDTRPKLAEVATAHWMLPLVQHYLERCTAQRVEPDGALLEPILPVLVAKMQQEQEAQERGEEQT